MPPEFIGRLSEQRQTKITGISDLRIRWANQIRIKRAQLKRDLKSGRLSIHTLLLNPPEYVETAKVFDMLLAVPKYGRVKVNKILAHCRVAPSKTIGGLSERQRSELTSLLHR